ncbi:YktB family protein [Peribacillus sp. Hz7]|uniref:YktB family protein n=1 Tax=Peribacillus sp. Hz7 TaxID=3344873 RepID=UPI0035CB5DF9
MNQVHFTASDFNTFTIDGLEERMDALKERIRPKLQDLGDYFAQQLSIMTGEEIFPHVAKHARRTINPPKDTWVAFAANRRGYKMMPHFQIGLWETHLFVWFAVIYEAPNKAEFGKKLEENADLLKSIVPESFVWSIDHMKPDVIPHNELNTEDLLSMFKRLQTVKKAEILCGIQIPREEAVQLTDKELIDTIQYTFETLLPLYKLQ